MLAVRRRTHKQGQFSAQRKKVKISIYIALPHEAAVWRSGIARIVRVYLLTLRFIRKHNEPYLPLPSQPQLVLIYRPQRDGRLSRRCYEVAPAEIRTCNLPIANPALYHTATMCSRRAEPDPSVLAWLRPWPAGIMMIDWADEQ